MITQEDLADINLKIPQAIQYLVEASTKLLLEVNELEYERDVYREKYLNEVRLRKNSIKLLDNDNYI